MIIASAIKHDGIIWPGKRHHNCIATITETLNIRPVIGEQGFIDEKGNFYDRKRAAKHALKCGQIKELKFSDTDLYSEDLY
jgi:hypothetical protein